MTDLLDAWRDLAQRHAVLREELERDLQRGHGVSLSEFEVLQRLAEAPDGKRRIQELADEVHISQSALSRLVSRLQDAGLVARKTCEHDGRGVFACISDEGRGRVAAALPTQDAVLGRHLA
jgi:DNA-binding MarR family transcriptional regulator